MEQPSATYAISCACERGLRKQGHSPAPLHLQFPPELPSALPEHFRKHFPQCKAEAKQTQCFPPALPGLGEAQVPFSPIPTTSRSTSLGDTFGSCITTPNRAAKHPREPRPLQTMLFLHFLVFPVQNCRKVVEITFQIYFPACFCAGGVCVCTKQALYLITCSLNDPCPLECPISLGNESVWWYTSTHVAAMC